MTRQFALALALGLAGAAHAAGDAPPRISPVYVVRVVLPAAEDLPPSRLVFDFTIDRFARPDNVQVREGGVNANDRWSRALREWIIVPNSVAEDCEPLSIKASATIDPEPSGGFALTSLFIAGEERKSAAHEVVRYESLSGRRSAKIVVFPSVVRPRPDAIEPEARPVRPYPYPAESRGIEGRTSVSFRADTNGRVTDVRPISEHISKPGEPTDFKAQLIASVKQWRLGQLRHDGAARDFEGCVAATYRLVRRQRD